MPVPVPGRGFCRDGFGGTIVVFVIGIRGVGVADVRACESFVGSREFAFFRAVEGFDRSFLRGRSLEGLCSLGVSAIDIQYRATASGKLPRPFPWLLSLLSFFLRPQQLSLLLGNVLCVPLSTLLSPPGSLVGLYSFLRAFPCSRCQ